MKHMMAVALLALMPVAAVAGPKDDLVATDNAFSQLSMKEGSSAAFLAYIADDGRIYGTGSEPPIIGKAAATVRFTDPKSGNGDPKLNVLSWVVDYADVSADGTLGTTDGHWLFEGQDAKGGDIHLTGHYLTVWRKNSAGGWKVLSDMGTTDPAK